MTSATCPQDGSPQDAQLILKDLLSSNYQFIEMVGTGGMSVIYKARQLLLDKTVAIKMLHSHIVSEQSIMRFQLEAKAASSLKHPNVISVLDFGVTKTGQPYMVMDFIDGKTLAQLIKERGSLPLPEAMDIFLAVCSALEHAHSKNVLHRDLKPSNIMLRPSKNGYDVFLVDFGIAKIMDTDGDGAGQQLTHTGDVIGSPLYMSPEQCMNKKLDQRSDIYSLGCILYETVVGFPPHRGETLLETIHKHLNETAAPLHEVRADISFPEAFEELLMQLLSTSMEDRIQNVSTVKQRLLQIEAGEIKTSQSTTKVLAPSKTSVTRVPVMTIIGIISIVAGLTMLGYSSEQLKQAKQLTTTKVPEAVQPAPENVEDDSSNADTSATSYLSDPTYLNLSKLKASTDVVRLDHSKVTDGALYALFRLTNLRLLGLANTSITDNAITPLLKLNWLYALNLRGTNLTSNGLSKIAGLRNLRELDLSNTACDNATLQSINKIRHLRVLDLTNTKVDDGGMAYLQQLKELTRLAVSGKQISAAGLSAALKSNLTALDLSETDTKPGLLEVLRGNEKLTSLRLSKTNLSSADLQTVGTMKNLQEIELDHIGNLKDSDLKYFVPIKSLGKFGVNHCHLTDAASAYITRMPQLTELKMNATQINDKLLKDIQHMQKLEILRLERTDVSDQGIIFLTILPNLKKVYLAGTLVSDACIKVLDSAPKLNFVDVSFCPYIPLHGMVVYTKAPTSNSFVLQQHDVAREQSPAGMRLKFGRM